MLTDKNGISLKRGDKVEVLSYGFKGTVWRFQGEDIVYDEKKLMSFFNLEPEELRKIYE